MDSLEQPRHWKMDTRFGTWNVTNLYRLGSLRTEVEVDFSETLLGSEDRTVNYN
jgi:hypothetical protein